MKKIFNGLILPISLVLILIFSLGLVSASDDSNVLADMANDDNILSENIISDSDFSSPSNVDLESNDLYEENDLDSSKLTVGSNSGGCEIVASSGSDFNDIQDLIDQANENDTITLSGTYKGDSRIVLNKTITLEGDGSGATLDGQFLTQILEVSAPNALLKNIAFINSYSLSVAISSKNVTIDNCSFENSINGELGSALSCYGDNVRILNSRFLNNIANKSSCHHTDGPAIYAISNNAVIDNCTFINNTGYNYETASSGGAIWLKGFNCSLLNSVFINNSAISKFAWTLHGEERTFLADGYGGAVHWAGNNGTIDNCSFTDCIAHTFGGVLYFKAVKGFLINNTNFTNCYAVGDGGALYLGQNVFNLTICNSNFEDNVALGVRGVITQHNGQGGAIFARPFVENLTVFNSTFLNNYGNSTIYFMGSTLNVSNSIFNQAGPIIENETLEKFLSVLKNSTLEDCNLEINNFTLYLASGGLFENVIYTNGSLDGNYWGSNIASDEFKDTKLVQSDDGYVAPDTWANLAIAGLNSLREKGVYEYKFRFILNDDSDIELSMPNYEIKLEHDIQNNLLDSADLCIMDNCANLNYGFVENGIDNLTIRNRYGKFLDSLVIMCGVVVVEDTGNDTADIQNAINGADAGNIILLMDRNYTIDTISIDKDISIYSQGLANVSSSEGSNVLFNIASKADNPQLGKVEIKGLNFIIKNGDILVLANAINHTNDDLIDIPNILITDNNILKSTEDVVSESVTLLKLSSPRAILATTGNISVINNDIVGGVNPFIFEVTSVLNGSDVTVIDGSIIHNDSDESDVPNKTIQRGKSLISSKDMTTAAVYGKDGKIGKYFTYQLTDSNSKALVGKQLIINFNGKNYYRTTDKNGYVKFQINLAKKGTYTIVACFLGDDNYNASFKSSKIKVNPVKAKLKVSNKKYKFSLKKKTLTAKFLSPKGKAVNGKKISFRINGKTYTAKTNSKGIATVKVTLNKKKTYGFTAKFAGDNTFKSISVKGKVVVK